MAAKTLCRAPLPASAGLALLPWLAGCGAAPLEDQPEIPIVQELSSPGCGALPAVTAAAVVELSDEGLPPCEVVAIHTGIVLKSSADGSRPDPVRPLIQDSRGIIYTNKQYKPGVLVWSAAGDFLRELGPVGEGPGEFASSPISMMVDPHDTLHVVDGRGRWQVFDPEHRFVRMGNTVGRLGYTMHLTGAGQAIYSYPTSGSTKGIIGLRDLGASTVRPLGEPRPGRERDLDQQRPSTWFEGHLWIAPLYGTGEGFVIERRDTTGALVQLFKREPEWLPLGGYPDEPMMPNFNFLHFDQHGYLWTAVGVKDPRWRPPPNPSSGQRVDKGKQGDLRFEVIDPAAGAVIASVRYDELPQTGIPPIFPVRPGTNRFWGAEVDSLGFVTYSLYDLHLVRRGR